MTTTVIGVAIILGRAAGCACENSCTCTGLAASPGQRGAAAQSRRAGELVGRGIAAGLRSRTEHVSRTATAIVSAVTEPLTAPYPVPEYPVAADFERPAWLERGQGLTVSDDGRVAGYFHDGVGCIVGAPGHPATCTPPTPSPTDYAAFHQQDVTLADGSSLRVGVIGNVGGHADPYGTVSAASRHYADPNCQQIIARAYDDVDEHGQWHGAYVAGVLVPGLTYGDVAALRRSALSGDWRPMDAQWFERNGVNRAAASAVENFDCIGPTLVNRPGLPLVRAYRAARAASATAVLGGLGGIQLDDEISTDHGGPMQTMTLADGTVLEVPDGSTIEARADGVMAVTVPAPPAAPAATAAVTLGDPAQTVDPLAPAEPSAHDELAARVASIDGVLTDRIVPFIDACETAARAEEAARLAALDAPPALPEPVAASV